MSHEDGCGCDRRHGDRGMCIDGDAASRLRRSAAAVQVPGRLRRGSLALRTDADECGRELDDPGLQAVLLDPWFCGVVHVRRSERSGRAGRVGRARRAAGTAGHRGGRGFVRTVRNRRCAGSAGSVGSVGRRESLKRRDAEPRIGERKRVPASCSPMLSAAAVRSGWARAVGSTDRIDQRGVVERLAQVMQGARTPCALPVGDVIVRRDEDHRWLCPPQRA